MDSTPHSSPEDRRPAAGLVPHRPRTSAVSAPGASQRLPWNVGRREFLLHKFGMIFIYDLYVWFVYDLCMIYVWFMYNVWLSNFSLMLGLFVYYSRMIWYGLFKWQVLPMSLCVCLWTSCFYLLAQEVHWTIWMSTWFSLYCFKGFQLFNPIPRSDWALKPICICLLT